MLVDSTAYGDGCYGGNHASYGVDAGCLAVIPLEFCDETKDSFADGGWINRDYCGTVKLMTEDDGSFTLIDEKTRLQLEHVETGEEEEEAEEDWPEELEGYEQDSDD